MRTWKAGILAALIIAEAQLAMAGDRQVTACMKTGSFFNPTEYRAKYEATQIFAKIDVELKWVGSSDCPAEAIRVQVNRTAVPGVAPNALACAYPFDRNSHLIVLFRDRVEEMLNRRPSSAGTILGHILAHEIGHVLLGTDTHAPTGVMKAGWNSLDLGAMLASRLEFSPLHSEMIRSNLVAGRQPVRPELNNLK
jgi:hypothetical protein